MSNRIKVLSEDIANKIAAGEVVERPASVVKELIENAIDADSTRITVEIKSGGKQLIRVIDNGLGMSREDAVLAFDRHATSKVSEVEDLSQIGTFGFRGEALPSISSVSKVDMTTNTPDGVAGTRIRIDGGVAKSVEDVGRAAGTTVSISHLFYNIPARRKFLRGIDTEQRHIANIITTTAMAYPELSFSLTVDGREAISLPSVTNTYARSQAIIGDTLMNQMIPVTFEDDFVRIAGFISRPEAARIARTHQHMFINLRPINSRLLNHAVYEGFGSLLPKDRYPFTIIYLTIDLDQVDVNVHPAKREIRFSNDSFVYERMLRAVRLALQSSDVMPQFETDAPIISGMTPASTSTQEGDSVSIPEGPVKQRVQIDLFTALSQVPDASSKTWEYSPGDSATQYAAADADAASAAESNTQTADPGMISLWQLHNAYIFAQIKGGLVIVDQHAAHERILFEQALDAMREESGQAQQLLFPVTLDLMMSQFALVQEHLDLFNKLGFSLKLFGGQTVVVDAVSTLARKGSEGALLQNMIEQLQDLPAADLNPAERIAMAFSYKAGITKGVSLSQQEMNALINDLFATSNPYASPSGRPIVVRSPLEEIERKFNKRS
jgi:DNA mismatch repair protein MutL